MRQSGAPPRSLQNLPQEAPLGRQQLASVGDGELTRRNRTSDQSHSLVRFSAARWGRSVRRQRGEIRRKPTPPQRNS